MAKPVRIAVLSDLHVWRDAESDSWDVAMEAFDAAVRTKVDHVVVAGDVFDCATALAEDAEALRRALRRRGLWNADRLTMIVGNHDIFHTAHRGSWAVRAAELGNATFADAQESYDAFCAWAGDLVMGEDLLADDDLYPFAKQVGHVVLYASDTTGPDTARSVNGYWSSEDDAFLRCVQPNGLRTVLAIHHPPEESPEEHLVGQIGHGDAFGFPRRDYRRLERFADDTALDAIVCGHIHDTGGAPWSWTVGRKTRAFMMGRTGGMHDVAPCIGILTVPERGAVGWRVQKL